MGASYRDPGEQGTVRRVYLRAFAHFAEYRILIDAERIIRRADTFFSLASDLLGQLAFAGKRDFLERLEEENERICLRRERDSGTCREVIRRLIGSETEWDRTTDIAPSVRRIDGILDRETEANARDEEEVLAHERRFYEEIRERLVRRDGPPAYEAIFRHCVKRLSEVLKQDEKSRLEYEELAKRLRFDGYDDMTPIRETDRVLLRALLRESMDDCYADVWRYFMSDLYLLIRSADSVVESASVICGSADIDRVVGDVTEGMRVFSEAEYLHETGKSTRGLYRLLGSGIRLPGFPGPEISVFPAMFRAQERILAGFSVLLGIESS